MNNYSKKRFRGVLIGPRPVSYNNPPIDGSGDKSSKSLPTKKHDKPNNRQFHGHRTMKK